MDVSIVVRSASERTADLCMASLKQALPNSPVHRIEVAPFSAAVKEGWKVGLAQGTQWILCIDADVIVSPEGLRDLISCAERQDSSVFEVQGLILDKFIPVYRPAGNHLYRAALVERAMNLIPEEGTSLRPESDMLKRMSDAGFPWVQCSSVVGLHDYGQLYNDIYRKCFLHARKHAHLLPLVESYWTEKGKTDADFKVALFASTMGRLYEDKVLVDKRFLSEEIERGLDFLGLAEKSESESLANLDAFLGQLNRSDNLVAELQEKVFSRSLWNRNSAESRPAPVNNSNVFSKAGSFIGNYLIAAGNRLKRYSR